MGTLYGYGLLAFPHIVFILGIYFIYKALRAALLDEVPSAPAAIGRALGLVVLGQIVSFYCLWYASSYPLALLGLAPTDPHLSILHGPIGIVFSILAGYLAMRTFENTKSMNVKIVAVIGVIPQGLITILNFGEGFSTYLTLLLFVPSVFVGAYVFKKFTLTSVV